MLASNEYDKGDIIMQKSMNMCYPIKIKEAIKQIKPLYYELVRDIYKLLLNGKKIIATKQDESKATYSLWLDSEDYFIDWQNWSAKKIKRFIDAVGYPFDNAKAYLNDEIVKFVNVEIVKNVEVEHRERHIGKVIFIKDSVPVVVCSDGLIGLKEIRDVNNNEMFINFRSRFK